MGVGGEAHTVRRRFGAAVLHLSELGLDELVHVPQLGVRHLLQAFRGLSANEPEGVDDLVRMLTRAAHAQIDGDVNQQVQLLPGWHRWVLQFGLYPRRKVVRNRCVVLESGVSAHWRRQGA